MKTRALTFTIAIVVGLTAGFVVRAVSNPRATPSSADGGDLRSPAEADSTRPGAPPASPSALVAKARTLEDIDLSESAGVTHWLHWVAALESATLDDLPRLAAFAKGRQRAEAMLVARWMELDPRHLFDLASSAHSPFAGTQVLRTMMKEWIKTDLTAAVDALRASDAPTIGSVKRNHVSDIVEQDAEIGLGLFVEWGIENYTPRMGRIEKWARGNPRHAAEFAIEHHSGAVTEEALKSIGKIWGEQDPAGALAFVADQPSSHAWEMASHVLKAWAGNDMNAAAAWLGRSDERSHHRLAPAFVEAWAATDPTAAIAWSEENLDGSALTQAIGAAVKNLAKRDRSAAAELVSGLSASPSKSSAASEVANTWMPGWGEIKPLPRAATDWMTGLDSESLGSVLDSVSWRWIQSDIRGLADFVARPDVAPAAGGQFGQVARAFARHDPTGAMQWAQRLPEEGIGAAAQAAFASWHSMQPAVAIDWLTNLPSSTPNHESLVQSSLKALIHHPRAGELLPDLPGAFHARARDVVGSSNLREETRELLLGQLE